MDSPFNKSFISKSPLRKHKAAQRKINQAKREWKKDPNNDGGDFEEIHQDLYAQRTAAEKAHNTQRTEEGDAQVREDEEAAKGSGIEMKSPLHGYVDASDMVDPSPPTAHMWNKVFDALGTAGVAIVDAKVKKDKDKKFNLAAKGIDETSDEYKNLWVEHYGPIKPKN